MRKFERSSPIQVIATPRRLYYRLYFGKNREKFEADLRASILAVEPSGQLTKELSAAALIAWKDQQTV